MLVLCEDDDEDDDDEDEDDDEDADGGAAKPLKGRRHSWVVPGCIVFLGCFQPAISK